MVRTKIPTLHTYLYNIYLAVIEWKVKWRPLRFKEIFAEDYSTCKKVRLLCLRVDGGIQNEYDLIVKGRMENG